MGRTDAQVIVVGAGPVGLMLAGELRLGGAQVVVLERLAAPTTESRASTLHARTMEILAERGLLARLDDPPNQPLGHFAGIPLDLGCLATPFPGQWKVPQTALELMLGRWVDELGVEVRRGHEVVALAASEDRVRVRVSTGAAGQVELSAGYVVGCDGEDSSVRGLAGFEFPGRDATRELLRADVAGIDVPDRRFERLPHGLAIAARRPDGVTRVMVGEFGRAAEARTGAPAFDEVCARWARVTGEDISAGVPLWVNAFGNANRIATRYRDGRVLLAGDAAHRQMPIGGQALNLGIQDAVNLGWKLASVVCGRAPARLLDSYDRERAAVGRRVLRNIQRQSELLLGGPEVDAARARLGRRLSRPDVRDELAGAVSGLDVRYVRGRHPLVGRRMPHLRLDTPAGTSGTADLLHAGRGVLLDLAPDAARRRCLTEVVSGYAGRVDLVTTTTTPNGLLAGLDTVVVRPDGYVAWTSGTAADPAPVLTRWFGPARGELA